MTDEGWSREEIKPKIQAVQVNLASGWTTVVSAPISGQLRHIVNAGVEPNIAGSGLVNFAFAGVRTSGASGSESQKRIFPMAAQTPREWGGNNLQDEVVELRTGEELVGRGGISGIANMDSLWWEE